MKHLGPICLLALMLFISVVFADSEYCLPSPNNMTTTIDHQGNWYNITITSVDCFVCTESLFGFGDVECVPCDEPPDAMFSVNATCGVAPAAIQFTDVSTNSPYSWSWDFNEGNTSTDQNPVNVYVNPGVYGVNFSATNLIGTGWYNVTNYILIRPEGDTCGGISPAGNATGITTVGKEPVPLKTELVPIPFLIIPFLCLAYIFRGYEEEGSNPLWGDVLASGLGAIVCGVVALWFIQGGITSVPVTLENASYSIPSTMMMSEANAIVQNASREMSILGSSGNGMFISSALSTAESSDGMMITVHTHDIVVQQYQDLGVAFLYMLIGLILVLLFAVSLRFSIDQIRQREDDEGDPENWRF